MPKCCDCGNFKLVKGWKKATCACGNILYGDQERNGDTKYFKYRASDGILGDVEGEKDRTYKTQELNPTDCKLFDNMKEEI